MMYHKTLFYAFLCNYIYLTNMYSHIKIPSLYMYCHIKKNEYLCIT